MPATFVIGGAGRLLVGLLLAITASALLSLGADLDWGVAWTTWLPALALLLVGVHLVRRVVLRRTEGGFDLETGWLFRRGTHLTLAGFELELVPTAGLWAVVLHRRGRELPLATWLTRRRADALAAWLDAAAGAPLPRRERPKPAGDR